MKTKNKIIAIETTCDETAIAILDHQGHVYSHKINSQEDIHKKFGGVVPEIASRKHYENILLLFHSALKDSNTSLDEIEFVSVSHTPGMIGPLLIGVSAAKTIAASLNIKLVCVNHIEAHIYSSIFCNNLNDIENSIGVVISGGHTEILYIEKIGQYNLIGSTIDDAVGESFDKVASMLGFEYPGGKHIQSLSEKGDEKRFKFKVGSNQKNIYDISLSGLKTSVLYLIRKLGNIDFQTKCDIAASFQHAIFEALIEKFISLSEKYSPKYFAFGGGVVINSKLRQLLTTRLNTSKVLLPSIELCTDNAIMIGWLGLHLFKKGIHHELSVKAEPMFKNSLSKLY